jgi:hypothetical protein
MSNSTSIAKTDNVKDDFDFADDGAIASITAFEKFKDGEWTINGLPADPDRRLAVLGVLHNIRRWQNERIVETLTDKPLPDLEDLNASVPKGEWEMDLNGNPRPPYEHAHDVYLLNLVTGERSTHSSATVGTAIAVDRLKDKVKHMRLIYQNPNIVPQVELGWAPMNTKYGPRKRPDFKIIGWLDFTNNSNNPALPPSAPKPLPPVKLPQVAERTSEQALNDEIPWK